MDNLENYLYILFAVIYIISRVIKARSKQKQVESPAPQDHQAQPEVVKDQSNPKKAFSFQDILKEFEKNLAGEQAVEEEVIPVKEIGYASPASIPADNIDRKPEVYKGYQGAAVATNKPPVRSPLRIKENELLTRSYKYSLKENVTSEYVKMLQDPDGFKNALVLSEIINRKYY